MAALGARFDVPVVEDLGGGLLAATPGTAGEPTVRASIEAGVAACTFSGDKLIGGPQAGIVVGRQAVIDQARSHPLMRALRVDKLTYATLEATLLEHAAGRAADTVPVPRMITTPVADLEARADALCARLAALPRVAVSVQATDAAIGGGSTPGVTLPSRAVALAPDDGPAAALAAALREGRPAVVGRVADGRVLLDLRTVDPTRDGALAEAVAAAARPGAGGAPAR